MPDSHGTVRGPKDLQGQVTYLFFGFTSCPDVCPTSLQELADARDLTFGEDDDDFAVLDLTHELGADDVEGAGLGGEHIGAAEAAEDQRADADRVAGADHHVVGDAGERVGALDLKGAVDEAVDDAALGSGNLGLRCGRCAHKEHSS